MKQSSMKLQTLLLEYLSTSRIKLLEVNIHRIALKITQEFEKQQEIAELLNRNEIFSKAICDVSQLILNIVYTNKAISKCNANNLVGLYELIKYLSFSKDTKLPSKIIERMQLLLLQTLFYFTSAQTLAAFKCKIGCCKIIQNFFNELDHLFDKRASQLFSCCYLSLDDSKLMKLIFNQNIEIIQAEESCQGRLEASISFDDVVLCSIYLWFKINKYEVMFSKICNAYEWHIGRKMNVVKKRPNFLDRNRLLNFYNSVFLKMAMNENLNAFSQNISPISSQKVGQFCVARVEQNDNTYLDQIFNPTPE